MDYRLSPLVRIKAVRSRLDRPVASFTFDDFPRSALLNGGAILERHGAAGTFYVSGGHCGMVENGIEQFQAEDLRALVHRSHEIGDHGFAHLRLPRESSVRRAEDAVRNRRFVLGIVGDIMPTAFAYPFGLTSLRTKVQYAGMFASCRGTRFGINHGMLDLGQLRAVSLERDRLAQLDLAAVLRETRARNGWVVFYTHGVSDRPGPYDTPLAEFERVVSACLAAGIEILPMRNALARACC